MYSDSKMGIDWRALAGYLVAGALVAGTGGGRYGGGVISVAAVYGFALLACAIAGMGFLRWEEREYGDRR